MRMTNEEFQAEVFRRSAAYQREHTRRIRIMTRAAAAFAGCLLLTVGVGFAATRNNMMYTENTAATSGINSEQDGAKDDAAADYAPEMAEESSEEDSCNSSAEENSFTNAEKDTVSGAADDNHGFDRPGKNVGKQNAETHDTNGADSAGTPGHAVFVTKTEAEILEHYGLDAMPETLGGLSKYEVTNDFNYEDGKPGFFVSETEPDLTVSDTNTFCYKKSDDLSHYINLKLYTGRGGDTPVSYAGSSDPNRQEEEAVFQVSGLNVKIKAYNLDHAELEQIVTEFMDYLKEHKQNG